MRPVLKRSGHLAAEVVRAAAIEADGNVASDIFLTGSCQECLKEPCAPVAQLDRASGFEPSEAVFKGIEADPHRERKCRPRAADLAIGRPFCLLEGVVRNWSQRGGAGTITGTILVVRRKGTRVPQWRKFRPRRARGPQAYGPLLLARESRSTKAYGTDGRQAV